MENVQQLLLGENWEKLFASDDCNEMWDIISDYITEILSDMCPYRKIRMRKESPPWITREILETINDRNQAINVC